MRRQPLGEKIKKLVHLDIVYIYVKNPIVLCVIQKETFSFWIIANIFECEVKKVPFLTAPYSIVLKEEWFIKNII